MTKIKNTKKGMAKKTLSVSLAVAMLATSNVPVWAAEFSDGTDAVFTAEAEAPVVEETPVVVEETPAVVYAASDYKIQANIVLPTDKTWKDKIYVDGEKSTLSISVDGKEGISLKEAINQKIVTKAEVAFNVDGSIVDDKYWDITSDPELSHIVFGAAESYPNKDLKLYLKLTFKDKTEQILESNTVKINPVNINGYKLKLSHETTEYNGKDDKLTFLTVTEIQDASGMKVTELSPSDFIYTYGNDMVNAGEIEVSGEINSDKYVGSPKGTFKITPADAATDANLKADLVDGVTVEYQEGTANIPVASVVVTDDSKQNYEGVVKEASVKMNASSLKTSNEVTATVTLERTEGSLLKNNYQASAVSATFTTTKKAKVTARNLDNCTVTVKEDKQILPSGTAQELKLSDLIIKDSEGKIIQLASDAVKVETQTNNGVVGTYTVTVSSANDKLVTGSAKASFEIADTNLKSQYFYKKNDKGVWVKTTNLTQDYTGESIGDDLLKDSVAHMSQDGITILDRDVNYEVVYGENKDAGKNAGKIIVTGKTGTYQGSKKVFSFDINPAPVQEKLSTVPEKIAYVGTDVAASEYKDAIASALTVVACKNETGKDAKTFTLEYGKDYDIVIDNPTNKVAVNGEISFKVKVTNKNYFSTVTESSNNTTKEYTFTKKIRVANKAITKDDIQIKGEYTYTGNTIDLDYAVVVDGKELVKDKDYVVEQFTGIDAGTGSIKITGKAGSGYDDKVSATQTFEIKPADASNLTVDIKAYEASCIYNGSAFKPVNTDLTSVKLGTEDVKSQFTVDTTKYGENINAGEGTFVLKPTGKGLTNFTNVKEITFKISRAKLSASDVTYKLKDKLGFTKDVSDLDIKADGTAQTFEKAGLTTTVVVTKDGKTLKEGTDYVVGYYNNIDATTTDSKAYFYVQAINNYAADSVLPVGAEKDKIEVSDVIKKVEFEIEGSSFTDKNVEITNGAYNCGFIVTPNVKVTVEGKVLEEGKDYKVVADEAREVTVGKTKKANIIGLGMYKGMKDIKGLVWGVDKKDLKDCDVTVDKAKDGTLTTTVMNGTVKETTEKFETKDNGDGTATVSVVDDGKNYTGSKTVDITEGGKTFPVGKAMISGVVVTGNTAVVQLEGTVDDAMGYDYVISKKEDYISDRVAINKNLAETEAGFYYLEPGTYYAYCHAWTRDEDGKKAFGDWSNIKEFTIEAETPEKPQITSVKVSGSTVTVTYTESEGAEGYDIVLGSTLGKDAAGYKRPYDYGKLVKKNVKAGTTTVTFKNVESGTYYVGLHAWNKTSEDGKKVFSKWSNIVTRTVK